MKSLLEDGCALAVLSVVRHTFLSEFSIFPPYLKNSRMFRGILGDELFLKLFQDGCDRN